MTTCNLLLSTRPMLYDEMHGFRWLTTFFSTFLDPQCWFCIGLTLLTGLVSYDGQISNLRHERKVGNLGISLVVLTCLHHTSANDVSAYELGSL